MLCDVSLTTHSLIFDLIHNQQLLSQLMTVYKDILKTKSIKNILLSLKSIIKSSRNSAKESSIKLFTKLTERFNLIQYKNIESITKDNNNIYKTFDDICSNTKERNTCEVTLGTTCKKLKCFLFIDCFSCNSESENLRRFTNHPVHTIH